MANETFLCLSLSINKKTLQLKEGASVQHTKISENSIIVYI